MINCSSPQDTKLYLYTHGSREMGTVTSLKSHNTLINLGRCSSFFSSFVRFTANWCLFGFTSFYVAFYEATPMTAEMLVANGKLNKTWSFSMERRIMDEIILEQFKASLLNVSDKSSCTTIPIQLTET